MYSGFQVLGVGVYSGFQVLVVGGVLWVSGVGRRGCTQGFRCREGI